MVDNQVVEWSQEPLHGKPTSYPFDASRRLNSREQYSAVFDQTSYRAGNGVFLLLSRENGNQSARLGMVVAKRWVKRAVNRNLIKRKIREKFRQNQYQLQGLDLVLLCRSGVEGLNKREIDHNLNLLFDKIADSNHH